MRILVGDLSKLYGLSNQTLHYYEDRGILVPKRDVINGYRYYEAFDLQKLGTIKKYRNAGFALNDEVYAYEHISGHDMMLGYKHRRAELEQEIAERKNIITQLDWDIAIHERYLNMGEAYTVEELEGFLRFESRDVQIVFQEESMRREAAPWFKNIFFTASSEMWYANKNGNYECCTRGMIADIKTAERLKLRVTKNVSHIPAGPYLTKIVRISSDGGNRKEMHEKFIKYAKNCGYSPQGNMFTRFVYSFLSLEEGLHSYKKIMLPINQL